MMRISVTIFYMKIPLGKHTLHPGRIKGEIDTVTYLKEGGCDGSGTAVVKHYAYDTANSALVSAVTITVVPISGGDTWAEAATGARGYMIYNANVGDSFTVTAMRPGYTFPSTDTIVIDAASDSILTQGYKSLTSNLCRAYLYAQDIGADSLKGWTITASMTESRAKDSCNDVWVVQRDKKSGKSDATGYTYLDLLQCGCYDVPATDSIRYQITISKGHETRNLGSYYIPSGTVSLNLAE